MAKFPPYDPKIVEFDPACLHVDAKNFQFKGGGDTNGVTSQLRSVQKWVNMLAGNVVVWESRTGEQYIADGHQRRGAAVRLKVDENDAPIRLRGHSLREKDGWDVRQAMVFCALKNIAEGGESTSPVDVARLIRAGGDIEQFRDILSSQRKSFQHGKALAKLSDEAFGVFLNETPGYPVIWGVAVGNSTIPPERHVASLNTIANCRRPPRTETRLCFLVTQLENDGASGFFNQQSLFGAETDPGVTLAEGRMEVFDATISLLNNRIDTLRAGVRLKTMYDEDLAGGLNPDRLNSRRTIEERLKGALRDEVNLGGPLNSALTECARQFLELSTTSPRIARRALSEATAQFVRFVEKNQTQVFGDLSARKEEPAVPAAPVVGATRDMVAVAQAPQRLIV